ncbi:MAG: hypothetical protein LWW86_00180 [Micrococcales bacterium]|nr:hypothetical protein [Micrococcales bacterium]
MSDPRDRDIDEEFHRIIAGWDQTAAGHEPPAKSADSAGGFTPNRFPLPPHARDPRSTDGGMPRGGPAPESPAAREQSPGRDPLDMDIPVWRGAGASWDLGRADRVIEEEDDEHFEPGPPRALPPPEDWHFWGALVGLVGGPLLLLWLVIARPVVGGWVTVLGLLMCAVGFGLLVTRGPGNGPDDGAQV